MRAERRQKPISNVSLEQRAWNIRRKALLMGEVQGQGYIGQALGSACSEVPQLVNTRLVGMPRDIKVDIEQAPPDIQAYLRENVSGIWRENWYFRACGQVAELKITFLIKISGGTTFNISKGGVGPVS